MFQFIINVHTAIYTNCRWFTYCIVQNDKRLVCFFWWKAKVKVMTFDTVYYKSRSICKRKRGGGSAEIKIISTIICSIKCIYRAISKVCCLLWQSAMVERCRLEHVYDLAVDGTAVTQGSVHRTSTHELFKECFLFLFFKVFYEKNQVWYPYKCSGLLVVSLRVSLNKYPTLLYF